MCVETILQGADGRLWSLLSTNLLEIISLDIFAWSCTMDMQRSAGTPYTVQSQHMAGDPGKVFDLQSAPRHWLRPTWSVYRPSQWLTGSSSTDLGLKFKTRDLLRKSPPLPPTQMYSAITFPLTLRLLKCLATSPSKPALAITLPWTKSFKSLVCSDLDCLFGRKVGVEQGVWYSTDTASVEC